MEDANVIKDVHVWYDIEDDNLPVRCSACGRYGKCPEMVFIEQPGGKKNIIIHKTCVGQDWLDKNVCGSPPNKVRGGHRIWWTRKAKLRLVKK